MVDEKERFRSFAERYVIERAGRFDPASVQGDAWAAIHEAGTVYKMIEQQGEQVMQQLQARRDHAIQETLQGGAGVTAASNAQGHVPPLKSRPPPIPIEAMGTAELMQHIQALPISDDKKTEMAYKLLQPLRLAQPMGATTKGPYHGTPPNIRTKTK